MKEDELIKLGLQGDRKALEEIYNRFAPKMRGLCFRYVRTVFEVDDVLQEGFIKVFSKLASFSGEGSFEGWIRKIVVNTAINYYHSNQNFSKTMPFEDVRENEVTPVYLLEDLSVEDLYKIINQLPTGYRFIFNMFAIDGYSHKEIAESLNITESTSRSQYSRARKHLMNILAENNYDTNS